MGKLGCNCGAVMSSVDCPSENIIHIYSGEEIAQTLSTDPSITLWDFGAKRRTNEYWYCTSCGRVHEVDVQQGRCVRRFYPEKHAIEIPCLISVPRNWEDIYVITDIELDEATEKDFALELRTYLPLIKRRVMLSPDQKRAVLFDSTSGMAQRQFVQEVFQNGNPENSLDAY